MIIALHISIALNILALGLIFWFRKDQRVSNDLQEVELHHTHTGLNALIKDINNYQVETDRKIAELEKQLEIKTKQLERSQNKLKKDLPKEIRGVIGHIEFAQNNLR